MTREPCGSLGATLTETSGDAADGTDCAAAAGTYAASAAVRVSAAAKKPQRRELRAEPADRW